MSNPNTRKSCVVPKCTNTTTNAPDKLFFIVPKDVKMRKKWIKAMKRLDPFGDKSTVYCCEDHFDIENDMENYIKYMMIGGTIRLKRGIVPHKFKCQKEKEDKIERSAVQKRNQIRKIEKLLNGDEISALEKPEEIFFACCEDEIVIEDRIHFDTNEGYGNLRPCGSNIELEKFKRRLIRAVARMLLHEKRNEDEVWVGLRKETGCDCKELWGRMHALTIKKLDRLLQVEDRADLLPKPARMSITDWLMFDTVLVHEDFDVIGMKETTAEDKKILVDLFDLVEKHTIEFLAGDDLTEAWLKVTLEYNSDGRQCSPMLLQRRWYQLKLATRARFYKYWSVYKGIVKRQKLAEPFKPTPLQARIAFRYKPLVVKPFMLWEELIKNTLVISPEAFERKGNINSAKSDDIDPDVMCIEPVVETIDLDADSKSDEELEYRKTSQSNDQALIPVKEEPKDKDELNIDENTPYENRQEKILHFAEAAMEATAIALDEIELTDDTVSLLSPHPEIETDIPRSDPMVHDENDEPVVIEDVCKASIAIVSEANGGLVIENETKTSNYCEDIDCPLVEDVETQNTNIDMHKEPEPVLPQITSVFGGVDVSSENLSKLSLLTAQISKFPSKATLQNDHKPENSNSTSIAIHDDSDELIIVDDAKTNMNEVSIKDKSETFKITNSKLNCHEDIKPDLTKSWFGDLSNDIDFADDGIQLVDDGIAYEDNESAYQMPEIKTEVKSIIEIEEQDSVLETMEEDEPKVDEKLLLVPVVNMVKLDDLGILPIPLINHVDSKSLIDIITAKTKPIKKEVNLSRPIKKEINASNPIKREPNESESSDDGIIENIKRIKLSSNLLQKPRSRTYNPIQLCKNPDFNTRLKKLNVGFFSSPRNRLLLKACKPLSIDVSKAFEHKLVEGTMYLETNDTESLHKDLEPEENIQNVSVVPSAMAVQSLIDNTRGEIPPMSYSNPVQSPPVTCERNRIIKLPDISEIRRINQQLLTAEVTPLQVKSGSIQVPVTLVNKRNIESNPNCMFITNHKSIAGPASRTKLMSQQVVDITTKDIIGKDDSQIIGGNKDSMKTPYKPPPWKPRLKPEVPWYSNRNCIYAEDALLALDSLNKMLYLITDMTPTTSNMPPDKGNKGKKKGAARKERLTVKPSLKDDNDDVQVVSEMKLNNAEAKKCRKGKTLQSNTDKKQKLLYCCWARERICQLIFSKKQITKHNCPFPLCLCCCRTALVEFIRKKKEVTKPKTVTGALPLGFVTSELSDADTEDVTSLKEIKEISKVVAEVIPTEEKTAEMSTSDNPSCKENEDIKVDTIESEVNLDTVVNEHDSNQEEVTQMNKEDASDVIIGAEISVTTSDSTVTKDAPNITATNTNTIPIVKPKAVIRIKAATRSRKTTEKSLMKQIIQEKYSQVQQGGSFVLTQNLEVVEKRIFDDPTNQSKIQEMSPEEPIKPLPTSTVADAEMPKTYLNQKMIYLNSKQISELPSDNPIFLGKNKILLTTAIFPPNFKAFEAFQANIRQTLALPKGIQLLLLPSGRLTYVRDCKIEVSEEFMATLPQLISAIQHQINGSIAKPIATNSQTEVIDLSADEASGIKENTKQQSEVEVSKDSEDQTKSCQKSHTEDTEQIRSGDIPTVNIEETKTVESAVELKEPIDVNTSESAITPIEPKENSGKFKNILSDLMAMSGIEQTDVSSTPKENSSPEVVSIPNEDLSPAVASTSKEILSPVITVEQLPTSSREEPDSSQNNDCEEIQPIQHTINPPLLQPINSTTERNPSVQIEHTSKADDTVRKMGPKLKKIFTSSLTPITSLSELKYACAQSGSFFKLDLETGMLLPINVCMKKFADSTQRKQHYVRKLSEMEHRSGNSLEPKSVIDLTDDDVSEVTDITEAILESNLAANQSTKILDENASHNIQGTPYVDQTTSSSDLDAKSEVVGGSLVDFEISSCNMDQRVIGNNINKDGEVKPLKLFKSPATCNRPSILERKLKIIQKRIVDASLAIDSERRKLKRKQELNSSLRVDFENNLAKKLPSDDSDDDEPLAKIATKIRPAEKTETEINQNVSETREEKMGINLPSKSKITTGVKSKDNLVVTIDEHKDDELDVDLPMEEMEDMPIECLDESILDEDVPEEDCILGV